MHKKKINKWQYSFFEVTIGAAVFLLVIYSSDKGMFDTSVVVVGSNIAFTN